MSHRASIRDNDQAGWRSVRQRLIVLQLHQGCSRGLHDPAGHRRSVGGRAGDVGCVLEARAVRLPAGRSSVWCVAASNGGGSHVRVPLRRARMGRAANSAAPPPGSDWSSCSCRSCRAAASLTWVVRGRRCGLGLSCSCGGPGWAAAAHVDRPKRDQEGGVCFVLGFVIMAREFCQTRESSLKAPRNSAVFSNLNQVQVEDAPPSWRRAEPIPVCLTP